MFRFDMNQHVTNCRHIFPDGILHRMSNLVSNFHREIGARPASNMDIDEVFEPRFSHEERFNTKDTGN